MPRGSAPKAKKGDDGRQVICTNRKARHDYTVIETFEAGIELRGSEVKSLREGKVNLKDSYILLKNGEAWRISSNAPETTIEDSFFLADARGPQRSSQVVLSGMMGEAYEVRIVWNIEKVGENGGGQLVDPNDAPPAAA
jgi:hypothetical protein